MNVRIADDVPVVMLIEALVHAGLQLDNTREGLVLRVSPAYWKDGDCCGAFVPEFLRYRPANLFSCPKV